MNTQIEKSLSDFFDERGSDLMNEDFLNDDIPSGWSCKHIEHYGGEDAGSTYYTVYEFTHTDGRSMFVRFNGWYQSYAGAEFNDWKIVSKKEKTIAVYE
jgi:hypothetical protein